MNPSPTPAPFTSAHTRATITKTLLIAGALIAGLLLVIETLTFVYPLPAEDQEIEQNVIGAVLAVLMFLLGLLAFVVYVTTVVFFLMWLYRANNNLKRFNSWARLEYSAGWAVGSFFVPFANLIVPYRAVREVWQKSGTPEESVFAEPSPPGFFSCVVGGLAFFRLRRQHLVPTLVQRKRAGEHRHDGLDRRKRAIDRRRRPGLFCC